MSIYGWTDKDVVCMHSGILPAIKKNEIMPFAATWMALEMIRLSEVGQTETDTVWYHLYVEPKTWNYLWNNSHKFIKKFIKELIYKTERLTDMWNKHMVTKGEKELRANKLGVWD